MTKHIRYVATDLCIPKFIVKGYTFEKIVRKFSKSSAAIYLPIRFVGQKFKVVLIPIDEEDGVKL